MLDAGLELFGTSGYSGTTIEAICSQASLNARYFYEQFRHREELLSAVYSRQVWDVLGAVRAAIEDAASPADRLEAGLRAFVDAMLDDERGARVVYFEMVGMSPTLEHERGRVRRAYVDLFSREAARLCMSEVPDERRRAVAVALVGATDGLVVDWLTGDRRQPASALVDTLLEVFRPTLQ